MIDPQSLTDTELVDCIHEMRRRGWAVAVYDVDEFLTISDGWDNQPSREAIEVWFDQSSLEEAMSDAVNRKFDHFALTNED